MLKAKKAAGEEPLVEHKLAISEEDLVNLERYFDDVLVSKNIGGFKGAPGHVPAVCRIPPHYPTDSTPIYTVPTVA